MLSYRSMLAGTLATALVACGGDGTGPTPTNPDSDAINEIMSNPTLAASLGMGSFGMIMAGSNLSTAGEVTINGDKYIIYGVNMFVEQDVSSIPGMPAGIEFKAASAGVVGIKMDGNKAVEGFSVSMTRTDATGLFTSGSGSIGSSSTPYTAIYFKNLDQQQPTVYIGSTGQAQFSATPQSGSQNCPGAGMYATQIQSCTYGRGNLQGSFSFNAQQQGGGETISIPSTTFSVPSVDMKLKLKFGV